VYTYLLRRGEEQSYSYIFQLQEETQRDNRVNRVKK